MTAILSFKMQRNIPLFALAIWPVMAKNLSELLDAVKKASEFDDDIIFEEYIKGKEATCGIIDNFRGRKTYSLFPIEIKIPTNNLFDFNSKYSGVTEEICPGNFSRKESKAIQEMASLAHQALGLKQYSRSDFIVHPRRGVYILETNSLPGLTRESLFPKALNVVGCSFEDFLDHLLGLALR